jgi:Curlin associated repeat
VIRQDFTSASIKFWRKHEAEKRAIQESNLKKGIFMVVVFPVLFLILTFIFAKKAYAVDYNAIATAYVTTTISQNVVFDGTMKSGGTFTFSVLAHNGGGRAGQSDTANVKIQFYTSANALVSSVNSSYSANLPQPSQSGTNGLSGNPQADPAVPWSTLTISSTNCGGSCANVAYAKISMYGIDGSYWAGDYGPWYRAPTFTLNGGGNLAYNPEFGPYNGVTAQGWTSSPGFGACQGAWGGSNACIVNDKGQPGTSTAGLVANANGGGPSSTGGTTSGQAGGYNNTMSTNNAGAGTGLAQTAPPPPSAPTVTGTSTSNNTTSSSTTTNDFQGTQVVDITYNNGTISGYDSIVYGTDSQVTTTTVTTPVTTTTYSDGTSTTSNGASSTSQTVTDTYNVWKVYEIPSWNYTIPIKSGNSVYLNQSGSNPQVVIEQVGQYNAVAGVNNPNAYLVGNNNSLVIRQSGSDNLALVKVSGNNNAVQIPQGYYHNWANGAEYPASGSANDIALVSILGNSNWVFMPQQGYRNLATSTTNGNGNNNTIVQYGNDNKAYNIINGDGNSLGSWQQGNANLSTISMTGNGNQANTTQWGSNNSSTITLVNAGGPSSVNVTQTNNGTGAGNLLSIQQQCATLNGCSVTVNQTK